MTHSFRIRGLDVAPFRPLFGLSDDELRRRGAIRYVADEHPGFPDRVSLDDVEVGGRVLLVNHVHQPADNPYRASHAIFVAERDAPTYDAAGHVPPALATRLLSVRAFDAADLMVDADVIEGAAAAALFTRWLARPEVAYLHVHTARRGCYLARVDRPA
jgi:hypothetical protein